ncbi:MAG: Asp-tRNA(Asn)/Glu-tRNA(Gln) amidotransferase subunit GatA [Desulfobacterota bacterium]|nr:Asp-tRNA(Asn)/Glu-tRNA(Gln) amidotransferase subunit GatA [Thermodesulfobacteriota bacterium]MDW8001982.1 Asp-tRNA(Asn)/Glu-tRNA(Gln) amidotransferase subunit GatA [Deltaproteobacteria bacterium]
MTIKEIRERLKKKEFTSSELTRFFLERIAKYDGEIGSYIEITEGTAIAMAEEADRRIKKGEDGKILGIPLAVKDIICTKGIETTCASKILKGFIPPYDATVIKRLKEEGCVLLGKLNMDEFAMGSSTENSAFQITRNPWKKDRTPGGSSGGSSAAVATGLCVASLGTDTGGSIRQPASFCGIFGLKPTYGAVSRYGLIAFASSLDQIGPMARNVTDLAILLEIIAGYDPYDSTSLPFSPPDYFSFLGQDIKGLRIGIPKEYFTEGIDRDVKEATTNAIKLLYDLGAKVDEISLPHTKYALATYYIICTAEASSNLARYDGVKYGLRIEGKDIVEMYKKTRLKGFGKEVKRRIILGTYVLSTGYYDAYYKKASKVRTLIRRDFQDAFRVCDVIVTPTSPTTAFKLGEKIHDPLKMYLSDIFTIPANLAGLPAMSLPCGFDSENLPIGLQLIGRPLEEETLLKVAYVLEKEMKVKTIPDEYLS